LTAYKWVFRTVKRGEPKATAGLALPFQFPRCYVSRLYLIQMLQFPGYLYEIAARQIIAARQWHPCESGDLTRRDNLTVRILGLGCYDEAQCIIMDL
jgi:hypothetical protein